MNNQKQHALHRRRLLQLGLAGGAIVAGAIPHFMEPATTHAASVQAKRAFDFVNSIGVNTHWSVPNQYQNNYSTLKSKLGALGILHVRDAATSWTFTRANDLYSTYGIQTTMLTGRRFSGSWPQRLDVSQVDDEINDIRTGAANATRCIEGPNEYDISRPSNEPDWVATVKEYQKRVFEKVKADSVLKSKWVLGPSVTTHEAGGALGNISQWMDAGNGHFYKSNRHPGTSGWGGYFEFPPYGGGNYGSLSYDLAATRQMCGTKNIHCTECGYQMSQVGDYISERGETIYLPRLYAEYFRRGIIRSFKYELVNEWSASTSDPERNYGLLRNDLSEKPGYTALKSLLYIMNDTSGGGTPGSLNYTLSSAPSTLRHVLFQKQSGIFYLMLWNEIASYNPTSKQDIVNANVNIILNLATTIQTASRYEIKTDGNGVWSSATINGSAGNQSINMSVPDRVIVMKLEP